MAIFSGGKSTAVDSPRHLAIRHARKLAAKKGRVARSLVASRGGDSEDQPVSSLKPGEEKLNSYWAPGLTAGSNHSVSVSQTIKISNQELNLAAEQEFSVDAPQFSLPADAVHSVYPPPGYSDDHRILPHVVLTDPHLPWERLGSTQAAGTETGKPSRNRVPWLVVLSFSQDELRLPREHLDGPRSLFRNTGPGVVKPVRQSATMTVDMSVADLWLVAPPDSPDVATPVTRDPNRAKQRGSFIFVKPDLFTSLFSPFDAHGRRQQQAHPDPLPYQFLAHVRSVNPAGMALAGVEDTAIFSIVVGNRAGPLDKAVPTTVTAHLVSIEGVEAMSLPVRAQYVALCSLHSWNYTAMPPGMVNVGDALTHLGSTLDVLRAPESVIAPLRASHDRIKERVAGRLEDGYTLIRHQTQTGEPTMALLRGPLTPTYVEPGLANLNRCSNSGVDLQILDRDLGIMDVTYSVAWQVGRTLALGDASFPAALGRLRTAIGGAALAVAKSQTLKDVHSSSIRTRRDVIADLPDVVASLASIHLDLSASRPQPPPSTAPGFTAPGVPSQRWRRRRLARTEIPSLSVAAPDIQDKYPGAALESARRLAQSTDGGIYNETNDPLSADWMTVLLWLVDRMFLVGVPAHYLIPDPSFLGHESLRFFHIDANWVDALLDGALSLGNHRGVDHDRVAIKQALNDYISAEDLETGHKTQIPSYGFYLRSDVVTMCPDLRVQVLAEGDDGKHSSGVPPDGAPLLRHEIVADGVMMALMDRAPGSPDFCSLVFTQPPHQQRFAAAGSLSSTEIHVDIRRQYTVDQETRETDLDRHKALATLTYTPQGEDSLFLWTTIPGSGQNDLRILRLPRYADLQLQVLREKMPKCSDQTPYFADDAASSALTAMQLNDPVHQLTVSLHGEVGPLAAMLSGAPRDGEQARTLRQLEPSLCLVRKPNDSNPEQVRIPRSSSPENEGELSWGRPETTLRQTAHLAPHVRALPSALSSSSLTRSRVRRSPPAAYPYFAMRISSNVIGHGDVVVLQSPNLPQDLILSITVQQDPVNQYGLTELYMDIPLGPAQKSPDDVVYLMRSYQGPGVAMLTNLRFNALLANVSKNGAPFLRVRILPRAASGWIAMKGITEMSALLSLVQVNLLAPSHDDPFGSLLVHSWAKYRDDAGKDVPIPLETMTVFIRRPPSPLPAGFSVMEDRQHG